MHCAHLVAGESETEEQERELAEGHSHPLPRPLAHFQYGFQIPVVGFVSTRVLTSAAATAGAAGAAAAAAAAGPAQTLSTLFFQVKTTNLPLT